MRAKVDALLATDTDTLTPPGMIARATWADAWRAAGHKETAEWHFVDIEVASPDIDHACFDHPTPSTPASAGPAEACVIDRIDAFRAELASPATLPAERLLALKYLLHFVGDIHQPLHAADHDDRGGNCVLLSLGGPRTVNLHAFWDTAVVQALGSDPARVAANLRRTITPAQRRAWQGGSTSDWARESFGVAKATAYVLHTPAGCPAHPVPVGLPKGYAANASKAAALQLKKAGVRLAFVLNQALGGAGVAYDARW